MIGKVKLNPEYFSIPDVLLCGPYALGFVDFKPVPSTHLWREDVLDQTSHPAMLPTDKRVFRGTTVSLVNIWAHNYFHWVLECLVQLTYLDRERITRILLPPNSPIYIWQSLRLLNLADRAFEWDEVPTVCEELYGFGPVREDGHNYPAGLDKLRDTIYQLPVGLYPSFEFIYISREDATCRRVLNEQPLFELLRDKGWGTVVFPEGLTVQEQVQTFSKTAIILSSHGAGLTNMIWSFEKCKIVEMFGAYHNPCYEKLAQDKGFEYVRVDGTPVGDDLLAPLDILEEVL